nr:hypothethical protein [blood disease bacterium R229]
MRSPLNPAASQQADSGTRSPASLFTKQQGMSLGAGTSSGAALSHNARPGKTYPNATLRWPDGRISDGVAVKVGKHDYQFHLDQRDAALTTRKAAESTTAIVPLKVDKEKSSFFSRSRKFTPSLPSLENAGLHRGRGPMELRGDDLNFDYGQIVSDGLKSLSTHDINQILSNVSFDKDLAPGQGRGLDRHQQSALLNIFASTLRALADQYTDRPALRSAAKALAHPVFLQIGVRPNPATRQLALASGSSKSLEAVTHAVSQLRPGEHLYFPINYGPRGAVHAVGISVTRIGTEDRPKLRVSLTDTEYGQPGIFVDVSSLKFLHELPNLLNGTLHPSTEQLVQDITASSSNFRKPLRLWLAHIDPSKTPSSAYFGGKVLEQPIQNGSSCVSENAFAFMATVLKPSDYKLAKAACLNMMLQIGERHFAGSRRFGSEILARIKERASHALAGSALA